MASLVSKNINKKDGMGNGVSDVGGDSVFSERWLSRPSILFILSIAKICNLAAIVLLLSSNGCRIQAVEPSPIDSIEIDDGGHRRFFEISRDEFCVRTSDREPRIIKVAAEANASINQRPAVVLRESNGDAFDFVLYEKGVAHNAATRRILTKRVLVRFNAQTASSAIADDVHAGSIRSFDYAPGFYIFEASGAREALAMTLTLRSMPGIISADPLLGRKFEKKILPNDPLFSSQWFLLNTGQSGGKPGIDLNVTGVWEKFRGRGVNLAIVDDGLQLDHPDLTQNTKSSLHYDYRDGDGDPNPAGSDDYHGTAVAGVAAARANNSEGVAGVAFEANLVGIRLIGGIVQTDEQSADAMVHSNQVIQVSNNSWGTEDDGKTVDGPGPLMQKARENSALKGRGGKGTIFVWAGGNGGEVQDNVNYDGYANSMYVIAVAALNDRGKQAAYSEPGACLVVTAPSNVGDTSSEEGIATTDLIGDDGLNFNNAGGDFQNVNYTQYFGGTSSASAMVSGVVALMLEANPNLGWRDAKEILLRSATQIEANDSDWITNGAGFHFNHKFGAGLVNAAAAVNLSTNWINLGPQTNFYLDQTNGALTIPDNDRAGTTLGFDFRKYSALRVEHAVVTATILHPRRGDLAITLISPQGTRSRLAEAHSDPNPDFDTWSFTSVVNWGESSQGEWKLQIADWRPGSVGSIRSVRLDLVGTNSNELTRPWFTASGFEGQQFALRLAAQAGYRYQIQTTRDFTNWTTVLTTNVASATSIEFREAVPNLLQPQFFRAIRGPIQP